MELTAAANTVNAFIFYLINHHLPIFNPSLSLKCVEWRNRGIYRRTAVRWSGFCFLELHESPTFGSMHIDDPLW